MKTRTVWVIYRNTDLTEGRGRLVPWKAFVSRERAFEVSRTAGVQGSPTRDPVQASGYVWETEDQGTLFVPKSSVLGCDTTPPSEEELQAAKEAALGKLSPLEKLALGFSD